MTVVGRHALRVIARALLPHGGQVAGVSPALPQTGEGRIALGLSDSHAVTRWLDCLSSVTVHRTGRRSLTKTSRGAARSCVWRMPGVVDSMCVPHPDSWVKTLTPGEQQDLPGALFCVGLRESPGAPVCCPQGGQCLQRSFPSMSAAKDAREGVSLPSREVCKAKGPWGGRLGGCGHLRGTCERVWRWALSLQSVNGETKAKEGVRPNVSSPSFRSGQGSTARSVCGRWGDAGPFPGRVGVGVRACTPAPVRGPPACGGHAEPLPSGLHLRDKPLFTAVLTTKCCL